MKVLVILAAVLAVTVAESVTLLNPDELSEDVINDPRYLLWETEEGLYRVEDLESRENATVFVAQSDVTFFFSAAANPIRSVQIRPDQLRDAARLSGFNVNRPTVVFIHGWTQNHQSELNILIRNEIFRRNNINFINVDWSPISTRNYVTAQGSVVAVGNHIGDFLLRLERELNYNLDRVTIAGHSLGGHISGTTGARTRGQIGTIIGLDPAGPLFTERNTNNRLDPTDGRYVHVIHTNDGTLGLAVNMGHADYYPNGGRSQPGCGIDLGGGCAHVRAVYFLVESFTNDNFLSRLCASQTRYDLNLCRSNPSSHMGGFPIRQAVHGEYFLRTNSGPPFARG